MTLFPELLGLCADGAHTQRVKLFDPEWAPRTKRLISQAEAVFDQLERVTMGQAA